jgi:hypothetical protein
MPVCDIWGQFVYRPFEPFRRKLSHLTLEVSTNAIKIDPQNNLLLI